MLEYRHQIQSYTCEIDALKGTVSCRQCRGDHQLPCKDLLRWGCSGTSGTSLGWRALPSSLSCCRGGTHPPNLGRTSPSGSLGLCDVFWQSPGVKAQIAKGAPDWEAPGRRAQGSGCLVAGWEGGCKQTGHNSPALARSQSQEPVSSHQCGGATARQPSGAPAPLCAPLSGWDGFAEGPGRLGRGCWGCPALAQLAPARPSCPALGRQRVTATHHGPTSAGPSPGLTTALPRSLALP